MSDQDDSRSLAQDFLEAYEANPREEIARALAEQRGGIVAVIRDAMHESKAAGDMRAAACFSEASHLANEFRLEVES